jgi:DNA-binding IclR family transcriptional regulator
MHDAVALHPGLTVGRAAGVLSVSHSTASYQLRALTRLGLVEQLRDGRELRHFLLPRGSSQAAYVAALMRDAKVRRLLEFLGRHDVARMTINQVAKEAGVAFGFARRTLLRLQEMGLVRLERRSYRYTIQLSAGFQDLVLADAPR